MAFTEAELADFKDYAQGLIAEYCPRVKKAVSPHAANQMKKNLLQQMEQELLEAIGIEGNKAFFHELVMVHCDAAILAQIRFSNKAFRATLTKEKILEKCRICNLDDQCIQQTLKVAGFN